MRARLSWTLRFVAMVALVLGAIGGVAGSAGASTGRTTALDNFPASLAAGAPASTFSGQQGLFTIYPSGDPVTVTASPSSLPADGTSTSSVTATVTNANGQPMSAAVTFTLSGSACGSVTPTANTTNGNGQAGTTYTASTTVGGCTITATTPGSSDSTIITQTAPAGSTVSVTPTATTVPANGTTTDMVTATVTGANGAPVGNDEVFFTTSGNPPGSCGNVTPANTATDANGNAFVTYTASTTPGTCTITVFELGGASGKTTITQQAVSGGTTTTTSPPTTTSTTTGGGGGGGGGTTTTTSGTTTTTAPTGKPTSVRLAGPNRIATAIAISQKAFPMAGTASSVSLARDDIYPDALAGGPFAAAKGGPLLLSEPTQLNSASLAEIQRVLPKGGTVYLLGGNEALSDAVATALTNAGFHPVRVSGPTRFATAVAIANALNPTTVFEASGVNFPDALSAGPAAVVTHGAILLTNGAMQDAETASYLGAHPGDTRYAVGGPAAVADPSATPLVGSDRFATSAVVANKFFTAPTIVGIATGLNFPDALAATPLLGTEGAPVLLVSPTGALPPSVSSYLSVHNSTIKTVQVFGGSAAVSDAVVAEAVAAS